MAFDMLYVVVIQNEAPHYADLSNTKMCICCIIYKIEVEYPYCKVFQKNTINNILFV